MNEAIIRKATGSNIKVKLIDHPLKLVIFIIFITYYKTK